MTSDVHVLLVEADPTKARLFLDALETSTRPRYYATWTTTLEPERLPCGRAEPEVVILASDLYQSAELASPGWYRRAYPDAALVVLTQDSDQAADLEGGEDGPDAALTYEEAGGSFLPRTLRSALRIRSGQNALRECQGQLRTVTECVGVGMVLVSAKHRYLFANAAYSEVLGLGSRSIVGKHVADVLPDVYEAQIRPRLERAFAGECVNYELRRPPAPGESFPRCFEVTYERQTLGAGAPAVMVVIYDITKRKGVETSLLVRERHSQALLRLSRRLERAESHTDILSSAREAISDVLGFGRVWLYQLSDDQTYLSLILEEEGDTPLEQRGEGRHLQVAGDAMLEELVAAVDPVVVEDARTDPRTNKEIVAALGNRTIVNIPIVIAGRTLGAFGTGSFGAEGVRKLTDLERLFLAALGSHVAAVLDRVTAETERRKAVTALRASEVRFRHLAESLPQSVWTCEPDGTCDYLSRQWLEYTGVPAEVQLGYGWSAQVHPEDRERTMAAWRIAVETDGDYRAEFRLRRHDGAYRWFDTRGTRIRDVGGRTLKWAGSNTDIEARKRAEDELKLFRMLVDRSNDAFEVIDPETGCFLDVSERGCADLGYSRDELLTMQVFDIDSTVERETWPAIIAKLRRDRIMHVEGIHVRKDGSSFPVEVNVGWVEVDREYVVAVVRDVTERRRLEEQFRQAQKMEAIGQLAGGVAHDFNNLLFVIFGYADLCLSQTPPGDPRRGMLGEIRAAGERAAGLTRQLLAFSRQQVLEPKVLCLNSVVADMEKMLQRLIGEDVELTTALAPDLRSVKIDPGQMTQVIMNLAVNARDAMPQGGKLRIETRNVTRPGAPSHASDGPAPLRAVMLTLSDTGAGMPPQVRERIFEPFFSTKDMGKGTGLGLAVVHGIVTQSGGEIQVDSEVGEGTDFRILLPAIDAAPTNALLSDGQAPRHGSEKILLVEDEELVRKFADRVLREFGYITLNASNGTEALHLAEVHGDSIDLLITDVVMPGMNGRQIAEALTARNPHMRVLFLSGYTDDAVLRHGVRQAEVAFLQKPVPPNQLAAKVRELLDQRRRPVTVT